MTKYELKVTDTKILKAPFERSCQTAYETVQFMLNFGHKNLEKSKSKRQTCHHEIQPSWIPFPFL